MLEKILLTKYQFKKYPWQYIDREIEKESKKDDYLTTL